jgi:hypothetical protein
MRLDAPKAVAEFVMAGLVPGIHVLTVLQEEKTWLAGTSPDSDRGHSGFQIR